MGKHVMDSRRDALRMSRSIEDAERKEGHNDFASLASDYRTKVMSEMRSFASKAVGTLESKLIPSADTGEAKAFYYKMAGDMYRYEHEFSEEPRRGILSSKAQSAYSDAVKHANDNLF